MTDHAEALAKALEVFAVMAKLVHPNALDKDSAHDWHIDPTVGQLRAARSALAAYRSRPAAEVVPVATVKAVLPMECEATISLRVGANGSMLVDVGQSLYATPALAGTEAAGEVVEALSNLQRLWDEHCAAVDRYNTRLASERADGSIPKRMGDLYEKMDDARHAWITAMQDFVKERSAEKLVAALRDQSEA